MELINEKLLDIRSPDCLDSMQLSFSNEPISIGLATKVDNNDKMPTFIVYSNNERGYRDWEEEFSDASSALDFAKKMWRGMKKAYAKFELPKRTTDATFSLTKVDNIASIRRKDVEKIASRRVRSNFVDKKHQVFVAGKLKAQQRKEVTRAALKIVANKSEQTVVDGSGIFPVVKGSKKKNS